MATQPTAPPNPTDDNHQNPASEDVQPAISEQHAAKAEVNKEISPPSVFVNSEPMREEQVQNAVKFLSHPKVRGSPVIYRRSFLERKGLTKAEIDEAFRLVPDPPQNVSGLQPAGTNQDGQLKSPANVQPQVSTQTLQPVAATPAGVISKTGTVAQSRFHWSHAFLAVGLLALSGAWTAVLFKNTIVPRLKSWICKVVFEEERERIKTANLKPSLEEEAAAAAKAAAAAAADVARACQEMLISKTEEKKFLEEQMNLIGVQVQEMKSMSNAIQKLEDYGHGPKRRETSNTREINDLPPNPDQPVPNPNLAPRAKIICSQDEEHSKGKDEESLNDGNEMVPQQEIETSSPKQAKKLLLERIQKLRSARGQALASTSFTKGSIPNRAK